MKRLFVILAAVLLSAAAYTGIASAQTPADDCGVALDTLLDARADRDAAQVAFNALPKEVPNPNVGDLQGDVTEAQAALNAARQPILELNPNVYPKDTPPANVGEVTPELLKAILADPDLGQGGRDEVNAALTAFTNLAKAEKALEDGRDIPNPDLKESPELDDLNAAKKAVTDAQAAVNTACAGQPGAPSATVAPKKDAPAPSPQVKQVPKGGVATGDGSTL